MMRILVLPCDGIGPEIISAAMGVLQAVDEKFGLDFVFDYDDVGFDSLKKYGTTLRDEVLEKAKTYDGIILGTMSNADYPPLDQGGRNVTAYFRGQLDLYANIRPARSRPFLNIGYKPMDLVVMREGTEGFYPDRNMHMGFGEFMPTPDLAISMRKITAQASARIARSSFEMAMKRRKKVTAVHKVSAFRYTDGLFLREVRKVAADFPEVQLDDCLVDSMAAYLVRDPQRFDVIVTTNFLGDILSDLASELSGGLGLAGSVMVNDQWCCAQAQHGSAPDIQGMDRANPVSMMLSCALMLKWIGENRGNPAALKAAAAIDNAIDEVLQDVASRTVDLGGKVGTKRFGILVAEAVRSA